jgi:Double zinc ribbon
MNCPNCKALVPDTAYFCPNCGKPVRSKPDSISISRQAWVYLVTVLAPPFGLIYAWHYFRQGGSTAKKIAIAIVVLTIISSIFTWQLFAGVLKSFNDSLNALTTGF